MKEVIFKIKNYFTSFMNEEINPLKYSLSVFMSVFVSCSPLFGLQTLIILFLSFSFKLNTPISILMSQISWPPTYALIVYAEIQLGLFMTGEIFTGDTDWIRFARNHFQAWVIGFLIFGTFLATLSGVISYIFFSYLKKRRLKIKSMDRLSLS